MLTMIINLFLFSLVILLIGLFFIYMIISIVDEDENYETYFIDCRHRFGEERVRFIADIPDYNQSSRWNADSKRLWKAILDRAEEVRTYNQNDGKSYAHVLNQRNIGMIDACDILIAIYNGDKTGGTANGYNYGKEKGKYITLIHPQTI